jgi:hypothetical protein
VQLKEAAALNKKISSKNYIEDKTTRQHIADLKREQQQVVSAMTDMRRDLLAVVKETMKVSLLVKDVVEYHHETLKDTPNPERDLNLTDRLIEVEEGRDKIQRNLEKIATDLSHIAIE